MSKSLGLPVIENSSNPCFLYAINDSVENFEAVVEDSPPCNQNFKLADKSFFESPTTTSHIRSCKNSPTKKLFLLAVRKRANLFKPFLKHFVKGKTSFLNSWSALSISNLSISNLLEETYVRIQISGKFPDRSVKPPYSSQIFQHSMIILSGSNIRFVRYHLFFPNQNKD